jgi:Mycoplasma protein of unknown function, DUF285
MVKNMTMLRHLFKTSDELMQEVDRVLDGISNETIYGNIKDWDVSQITNFASLFSSSQNIDVVSFNQDISRVVSFNQDISRWNISSATNTSKMF